VLDGGEGRGQLRAGLACLGAFLLVALAVTRAWQPLVRLDERWSAAAYRFTQDHPWCETLASTATWFGNGATIAVVTAVLLVVCVARKRSRLGAWLAVTVAGSALVNTLVKESTQRLRPPAADLLAPAHGYAFPSGHTQAATVTYTAAVLIVAWQLLRPGPRTRRAGATVVAVMVAAVGLSRVFLGAHWPSDVVGGWLLGGAWVLVATALLVRAQRQPSSPTASDAEFTVRSRDGR
jgi:membrane-associated phospholipid phosphatase